MNSQPTRKIVIANALIWSTMMIAGALLGGDEDRSSSFLILQVGGWMTTHTLISSHGRTVQREWRCIKRWLGVADSG